MNNITINHLNSFSHYISYFTELSEKQKKVAAVAFTLFVSLAACYVMYWMWKRQRPHFNPSNEELVCSAGMYIGEKILHARETIPDSRRLEEDIENIGLDALTIIRSEPEHPSKNTKEDRTDTSLTQQHLTNPVLQKPQDQNQSEDDQKITPCINPKTLYLEEFSDIPPEKFVVIQNDADPIDELVSNILSEPEHPSKITQEDRKDSSSDQQPLTNPALQKPQESDDDQKTTPYTNPKTLYLEEISDIPPEKFLVIKNYAYHIDELVSHILSKHGLFIDPYRQCMFDDEEIKKILSFKEASTISELKEKKGDLFKKIPPSAGNQLKKLAKIMSKDYDLNGGYQTSKRGIEHFQAYFSNLSSEEQEALESAIISYKDTSVIPPVIVRSTFKDVFIALATSEFCNHVAAFYFWILGMKIDPSSEPMPNEIAFTSRYWNNLLVDE